MELTKPTRANRPGRAMHRLEQRVRGNTKPIQIGELKTQVKHRAKPRVCAANPPLRMDDVG